MRSETSKPSYLRLTALALWGLSMLGLCSIMLARHLIPLPAQTGDDASVTAAIAEQRPAGRGLDWMAVHVLYGECGCSRRVARHLLTSSRPAHLTEMIVLVGDDPKIRERARSLGFLVDVVTREELPRKYHLQSVPVLAVLDPLDRLRYVGGYTTRKQGPDVQDLNIIRGLQSDRSIAALPLFGCAVSRSLQRAIDPTGLL